MKNPPATCNFHWESLAVIREEDCIGCARCINACPVDAIIGALKYMHTVIAQECTGCALCLPACPVDCIELCRADLGADAQPPGLPRGSAAQVERALARTQERLRRLNAKRAWAPAGPARRRREIMAAVARVRARRRTQP